MAGIWVSRSHLKLWLALLVMTSLLTNTVAVTQADEPAEVRALLVDSEIAKQLELSDEVRKELTLLDSNLKIEDILSHGLSSNCFNPSDNLRSSLDTSNTFTLILSPLLRISFGCFTIFVHDKSDT